MDRAGQSKQNNVCLCVCVCKYPLKFVYILVFLCSFCASLYVFNSEWAMGMLMDRHLRVLVVTTCLYACCCVNDSLLPDEKVCQSHSNSDGLIITSQLAGLGPDKPTNTHTHTCPHITILWTVAITHFAERLFPTLVSPTCSTFDFWLLLICTPGVKPAYPAEVEDTVKTA